jgi:hypothetical protein
MLSTRSASGKKARAPRWWGVFSQNLPKFYAPGLTPKTWTPELARKWVESIPSKCPFERQLWWKDKLILYIPPLCPFNPLSTQLYAIRISAQQYLADLDVL